MGAQKCKVSESCRSAPSSANYGRLRERSWNKKVLRLRSEREKEFVPAHALKRSRQKDPRSKSRSAPVARGRSAFRGLTPAAGERCKVCSWLSRLFRTRTLPAI